MSVKVFVDLTRFAAMATRRRLGDQVRELEDVGATGVSVSDHIFFTSGGRPRTEGVGHGSDPLTTLAAVAGLSERLEVQTVVANSAWIHPALLLRQFNQLAVLLGGERVTAGLGAGWSAEEFDALGLTMPGFRTRIDRLAEVLAIARELWTDGLASHEGQHVVTRDLRLSPMPERVPRLLVGGGSDRLLQLAGRFADLLDLHGDPKHGRVAGATMAKAAAGDVARRAHTTVDDLGGRIELVRDAAEAAGRPRDAVGVATQIWYVAFGAQPQVRAAEEELCARWAGIPYRCQAGGTVTGPVAAPAWGACSVPRCWRLVVRDSDGNTSEPCVSREEYDHTRPGEFWHGRTDSESPAVVNVLALLPHVTALAATHRPDRPDQDGWPGGPVVPRTLSSGRTTTSR